MRENCKMLGYKEGDSFKVVKDTGLYSTDVGDTLLLIKDDESFAPFFAISGTDQITCVPLKFLEKIVDTESQQEA